MNNKKLLILVSFFFEKNHTFKLNKTEKKQHNRKKTRKTT